MIIRRLKQGFGALKQGFGARARAALLISSMLVAGTLCAVTAWAVGRQGETATPAEAQTPPPAEAQQAPNSEETQTPAPEATGATGAAANSQEAVHKPTLRVWLHPDGIRPRLLRTSPGRVVLRLENETGEDVALVVQRRLPGGELQHVGRVAITDRGRRARREVLLPAGEYVFFDEARPVRRGTLVVEADGQ